MEVVRNIILSAWTALKKIWGVMTNPDMVIIYIPIAIGIIIGKIRKPRR